MILWDENVKEGVAVAVDNMDIFIKQLNELITTDKVERKVFSSVHASISNRIFGGGKDERGSNIGTYSSAYIKTRIKKNWGSSRKVILQLTGQMKNDFSLIRDGSDLASGFKNDKNGQKSRWVEETYNKEIFTASKQEEDLANELYAGELDKLIG